MRHLIFFLAIWTCDMGTISFGQNYYFPPLQGSTWETTKPEDLGWCLENLPELYDYLEEQDSKAFIVLVNGKIVLEKYFDSFTADSIWYWASAGKTITSTLVGVAQEQGFLAISDPTSKYLGKGWTSLVEAQENKITVRHQLTMTSGLDDATADPFCTLPSCLAYKADAGMRWAYHNGPYTLLDDVIKNATGQNLNVFGLNNLFSKTGMNGLFIKSGYNNVFYSKPRTMARFGSLILNNGNWNNVNVIKDKNFLKDAITTSQEINLSYGYLWWLNGKNKSMVPGTQVVFNRKLFVEAPDDMYSALGKNGQILNIIPSRNMVMIRMGNFNNSLPVPFLLNDEIWKRFNKVDCVTSVAEEIRYNGAFTITPNPVSDQVTISPVGDVAGEITAEMINLVGDCIRKISFPSDQKLTIETSQLLPGFYVIKLSRAGGLVANYKIQVL